MLPWPWLGAVLRGLLLVAKSLPTIYGIVVAIKEILVLVDDLTEVKVILDKLAKALSAFMKTGDKSKLEDLLCEMTNICPTKKKS